MAKYLGETVVDVKDTKFKYYTPNDWAMYFIESYGQIDGSHHKQWTMDQVARVLKGTKINIKLAKWDNGEIEYRINLEKPSKKYKEWIKNMLGDYIDGEYEYDYDEGVAP